MTPLMSSSRNARYLYLQDSNGYYNMDSPVGNSTTLEEHLASQIFNEFPEFRNVLGQILDGNL